MLNWESVWIRSECKSGTTLKIGSSNREILKWMSFKVLHLFLREMSFHFYVFNLHFHFILLFLLLLFMLHSEIRLSNTKYLEQFMHYFHHFTLLRNALLQTGSLCLRARSQFTWVLRGAKSSYEHSTVGFSNLVSTQKCCQPMCSFHPEVQFGVSCWFRFGVEISPSEYQRFFSYGVNSSWRYWQHKKLSLFFQLRASSDK